MISTSRRILSVPRSPSSATFHYSRRRIARRIGPLKNRANQRFQLSETTFLPRNDNWKRKPAWNEATETSVFSFAEKSNHEPDPPRPSLFSSITYYSIQTRLTRSKLWKFQERRARRIGSKLSCASLARGTIERGNTGYPLILRAEEGERQKRTERNLDRFENVSSETVLGVQTFLCFIRYIGVRFHCSGGFSRKSSFVNSTLRNELL